MGGKLEDGEQNFSDESDDMTNEKVEITSANSTFHSATNHNLSTLKYVTQSSVLKRTI